VPRRRTEDRVGALLTARVDALAPRDPEPPGERMGAQLIPYEIELEGAGLSPGIEEAAVLLDAGTEALLIAGAAVRPLPRKGGGADLLRRAAAGASAWKRERVRELRRLKLAEQLIAFCNQLNAARDLPEVHAALLAHASRIVGAYTCFLFLPDGSGGLRMIDSPQMPPGLSGAVIPSYERLAWRGLIHASEAEPDSGSPLERLAPLFLGTGARVLAHAPVGDGVLFLAERRADRAFEPEDWTLLDSLISQARVALERVLLFEEVRALSLTDPLTGLANRRQMDVVLKRSFAAARRGEPLSVALLDLDGFKAINDERGHLEGDRILCTVADRLREEVRGADLAVRFGGDEFLLILPGTGVCGARALSRRIQDALAPLVSLRAGAAEYHPGMKSERDLIASADQDLYAAKRGGHP
jgi:diguanylate cyclase (GGDEF)-like protein